MTQSTPIPSDLRRWVTENLAGVDQVTDVSCLTPFRVSAPAVGAMVKLR